MDMDMVYVYVRGCGQAAGEHRGRRSAAYHGTARHSTGPATRRPWGFPTCTGLRIPAGQASLGCAYAHPNCPSCAWAVLCIWPTQTQGLLINWTCWLLAGSAHDFTRKLFARKLQARLGHWVYTACAVLGLWCHAADTIGKIPAWKNYRRQNPSRGKYRASKSQLPGTTGLIPAFQPGVPGCAWPWAPAPAPA